MPGLGPWGSLTAADLRTLRQVPKVVDHDWTFDLVTVGAGHQVVRDLCSIASCFGEPPTAGWFRVYARRSHAPGEFSVGILLADGDYSVPLVRVNGPHVPGHVNTFPRLHPLPVTAHVHYLTEAGIREHMRRIPDKSGQASFALPTSGVDDLGDAVRVLARRANIVRTVPGFFDVESTARRRLP